MNSQIPIMGKEIMSKANALQEKIAIWRRTIHKHPELSFTEVKNGSIGSVSVA
jgi:metal-dependent amidase/aminoacylase/carboxypeptidase family protein